MDAFCAEDVFGAYSSPPSSVVTRLCGDAVLAALLLPALLLSWLFFYDMVY